MRKIIISLAAAASALAVASPAVAQWAPQQQHYGQSRGQVRALEVQIAQVRTMIERFDRSNRISRGEARRLNAHALQLRNRLHQAASRGLSRRERVEIQYRTQALREAVRYAARDNRRWGWSGQTGSNAYNNSYGYYGQRFRDDDRRGDRDDDRRGDRDGDRRGDRDDNDRRDRD